MLCILEVVFVKFSGLNHGCSVSRTSESSFVFDMHLTFLRFMKEKSLKKKNEALPRIIGQDIEIGRGVIDTANPNGMANIK